ncbi:YbgC/FadM family acyl-CoA thioesterase [Candidatus Deianiraea vastatrix]|uniref:Acyl-CoA thioester hydrolase YbgC n=1 Tax=Candidatus Deianiraea vastatrix TaxID=2163644 RepID=A0A5B8XF81_9RICK|nr:YbgC/FadM family acyl-CoA thioesterase [Candidatus Deianiraea vastatrix]QED23084.1 Acyl-CoA thioester hydrolase YbgC [Candidatus Deianiraea vastatrix]
MQFKVKYRIYYEDTDAGGVVYHSNYLNFAERARTEMLRECGVSQNKLIVDNGLLFVVQKLDIHYIQPLVLDDLIEIATRVKSARSASFAIEQNIFRNSEKSPSAILNCTIVCVIKKNEGFKPYKIPDNIINCIYKK